MESLTMHSLFAIKNVQAGRGDVRSVRSEGVNSARAFSLVEMLVVVTILVLLLVLATPALRSVANGYALTDAGQRLSAQIERARMHATTTQNITVMRFFATPGENVREGLTAFGLFEIVTPEGGGAPVSVTNPIVRTTRLREPVLISWENSSALQNNNIVALSAALAGSGAVSCLELYFFPDGSTSLAADTPNPYFTLLTKQDIGELGNPFVVSLDPLTSRSTIYRR